MNTTENLLLLNWIVATGTLFLEIILIAFLLLYFYITFIEKKENSKVINILQNIVKNNKSEKYSLEKLILFKIFILSFLSSVMTLIYSEYFLVIPCALCWFERVFMYGIAIISFTALFSRNNIEEKGILRYISVFSIFGAITSLYHHILQITATSASKLPCPVSGGECSKILIFEYNHITFPFMAFVMFLVFIFIVLYTKKLSK